MKLQNINMKKVIDYFNAKLIQITYEKIYRKDSKAPIRYLFYKEETSEVLIIVFSSLTRKGIPARYNYIRTLQNIKVNKLFILDDLGPNNRGCYCLGKDNDFSNEINTRDLIEMIKQKYKINKTIYVGSSKGGWCALNFGLLDYNSEIIVGACQYYLGNYFLALPDLRLEEYVFGKNYTNNNIKWLNYKLFNLIKENKEKKNKVHIHVSDNEHTYDEHVKYLIRDLKNYKYDFDCEILHYKNHGDIVKYFPKYLLNEISKLI